MKTSNKKEILVIIISFFAGLILMYFINDKDEVKEKPFDEIAKSVFLIETYDNNTKTSEGTGFVYKIDNNYAYILTNEHVIIGDKIVIKDNSIEKEATLLGKDKYIDLAVLKVGKKGIKEKIKLSKEEPSLGDKVYVIGNPLGERYLRTLTSGVVSGKDRLVKTELDNSSQILMGVLQTDASINHGSSGSPLINEKKEVIGIITIKLIDEEIDGMGFATPTNKILEYLDELEQGKEISWVELGATVTEISNSSLLLKNDISIPSTIENGVVVLDVKDNSNADQANLQKKDIITEINNTKITDSEILKYELLSQKRGNTITIKYIRDNKEKKSTIKLK